MAVEQAGGVDSGTRSPRKTPLDRH